MKSFKIHSSTVGMIKKIIKNKIKSMALSSKKIRYDWIGNHLLSWMGSISSFGLSLTGSQTLWFWSCVGVLRAGSGEHLHKQAKPGPFLFSSLLFSVSLSVSLSLCLSLSPSLPLSLSPSLSLSFCFLGPHLQHMEVPGLEGLIGATAAGLCHGHSNAGSEPHMWPTSQLTATPDP